MFQGRKGRLLVKKRTLVDPRMLEEKNLVRVHFFLRNCAREG